MAEVLFPNTVPPFFAEGNLVALPPTEADYDRALGRACRPTTAGWPTSAPRRPGRRAGIVQVFVNRIDDALAEVRWAARATSTVFGGILLPHARRTRICRRCGSRTTSRCGELCEELDVPINIHGGSGLPDYGDHEAARAMMLIELPWFAHRPCGISSSRGVLERHPDAALRRSPSRAWPGCPGASRRSTGSTGA